MQQVVSNISKHFPEESLKSLKNENSVLYSVVEFGRDVKISNADDAAVHVNGIGRDLLMDWGTHAETDLIISGFSSKMSFKWEDSVKPVETKVFEVTLITTFIAIQLVCI